MRRHYVIPFFLLLLAYSGAACASFNSAGAPAPTAPPAAAPPAIAPGDPWSALYGGAGGEEMEALWVMPDGGLIVAGSTDSFQDENGDAWIVNLSPQGEIRWQKSYGGAGEEYILDIRPLPDNGFIAVGWTTSFGGGQADFWVLNLDAAGNIRWQRVYGGAETEQAWSVAPAPDGGSLVVGGTASFGHGGADVWALRLDAQGDILWQRAYGGEKDEAGGGDYEEFVARALADRDGNYLLVTETSSFGAGETDIWALKLNPQGEILWQKRYGGMYEESLWTAVEAAGGGYILPGVTVSYSPDNSGDLWALRLEEDGRIRWQRLYGLPGVWDEALSAGAAADGGALLGGYAELEDDWEFLLLRLDEEGAPLWRQTCSYGWDWPNAIRQLPDGGFAAAGVAWNYAAGEDLDLWVMRLGGEGAPEAVCRNGWPGGMTLLETETTPHDTDSRPQETNILPGESAARAQETNAVPRFLYP